MQNRSKDLLGAACTFSFLAGFPSLVASISGCFFDVGVPGKWVSEKGVYVPLMNMSFSSSITSQDPSQFHVIDTL